MPEDIAFDLAPQASESEIAFDLAPSLPGDESVEFDLAPLAAQKESVPVIPQLFQLPKLAREQGAETGLTIAGGFAGRRAKALKNIIPMERKGATEAYRPFGGEETQQEMITRMGAEAQSASEDFLQAASTAPEDYGLDPKLETGLITQAGRGLTKGAGMMAMASAGGIPTLALVGSTEAFGAAKSRGKSDDEADKEATRSLIGLAIFGAANKTASGGITKYLGNASKLRTFLVQTVGQATANEVTSRAISAYEAALDAEPGKRLDAAVAALTKNDPQTIFQNLGFALQGGMNAAAARARGERSDIRLKEVMDENVQRERAERERVERVIAEQNAQAARLGEQRQAQGVPAGPEVSPEAMTPEQRARAEAAPPIVSGAITPSPPQQGQRREEEPQVDLQAGVVREPDGTVHEVSETGLTEVVPGSPKDVSMTVLGTKEPTKGEPSAVQEPSPVEKVLLPEIQRPSEGMGLREVGARNAVAETSPAEAQPKIVLSPFAPKTEGEQIISTGILGEDGKPVVGDQWNSSHAEIIKKNPELALLDDVESRKGFIIQDADGNQKFVGRKQALGVGTNSGQVDIAKVYDPEGHGLISEALIEPKTPEATPETAVPPEPPKPPEAATPEDRGRPPIPTPTGPRNAITESNRFLQGLGPRAEPLRRTAPEVLARAQELIDAEPNLGSRLIMELNKEARALLPEETAVVTREQVARTNEYNAALEAVNNAPNEAARRDAENRLSAARDANQEAYSALERAGTPTGQALAFRKLMMNRDYSLAGMEAEVRALKGGAPLAAKDLAEVKALHDRIKLAEDRAKAAEEKLAKRIGEKEFSKLLKGARQEASAARKEGKSILDRIISNGEAAQEKLRKMRAEGQLLSSITIVNPVEFGLQVQIGAGYIAKGIKTLAEFTSRLVKDFGPAIEPQAASIFDASRKYFDEALSAGPKLRTVDQAAARDKAGEALDPDVVYDVARAHVNAGIEGFDAVMNATAKTLEANHPGITAREVRDAFSGYGKVTRPSQAADRVKLREYRRLGQLASAIEDAQRKIAPMKSGPQRDKATEAVRGKMAELKRVMEENGIQVTSPKQQLATAEKAAVSRLTNSIESLERQIATKTRDAVAKGKRVATPEIEKLRTRVEELRKTLDEVSPRPEVTDTQRVEKSIASVEARIAELDTQLKTGAAQAAKVAGPTSAKLERLRAERDAMSGLVRELNQAKKDGRTVEQRKIDQALKSVDQQIADLDRQLKTGEVQVKPYELQVTPPKLEAKRAERDAMRRLRDDIRNLTKPKLTADQRAIKAVEKSIAELDRQIKEGGAPVPRGTSVEPSATLEALRSERDSMRSLLKEIREAGKTKRSPEEIALSRYKKSLETRTKALEDRMAKGDYEKKPKKETDLDKEALDARFQYQKAKDAYEQKVFEYDLGRRSGLKRAYDTTLEILNTSRAIMTSVDFSAPLRQGAFITLAHPIRSLKSFPAMFRASGLSAGGQMAGLRELLKTGNPLKYFKAAGEHGERAAFAIQESLSDPAQRPNAALYRQAGLDLTETGGNVSRRKLEEAYQSRFASKIPVVAGSQRAYTAFLNLLRADSFDSMVKNLSKGGKVTDAEAKAIANFVNIATGRGKYGHSMEQAAQALNAVFFAPKYVLSRFQLIANPFTGFSISGGSARVRGQVAKEYARFLIGAGVVMGLAQLAGADVEKDPRSSDFGKIKIGNTRMDPMGGLAQVTTLLARSITGKMKPTTGKGLVDLKHPKYGGPTLLSNLGTFVRQKFSPIVSGNIDAWTGKDVVGNPVTKAGAYSRLVVPLPFGDLVDAMVEQGIPRGMALSLVSTFGVSMSTYEAGQRRPKEAKEPWENLAKDIKAIREHPMEGRRR